MKIIALMGSPRKKGNSDLLTDAFLKGANSKGASFEKIYLNDLKLRGCQACLHCHKEGKCKQKDDMQKIYPQLLASDLWVLSTPVYWWGPSSQLKTAIDRLYAFAYGENPKRVRGKKAVLISTFADSVAEATPFLLGMLKKSLDFLQMKLVGKILVQAGEKGEVKHKPAELERAYNLGKALAEKFQS